MFDKILIPTDLTLESNAAFPYGITLAQAFASRLYLIHVMDPDSVKKRGRVVDFPRLSRFFRHERDEPDLPPLKPTVPVAKAYRYHARPEKVILDFAQRKGVDLICLASTPDNHRLGPWWSGSVTEDLINRSGCSVLCVRGQAIKEKDWTRPRFKHILLLTELGTRATAPLLKALPWAHTFNSMVHIFPLLLDSRAAVPEADSLGELAGINPAQTNVLLFADPKRGVHNLMNFVSHNQIDLIIVPQRARSKLSRPFRDIVSRLLKESDSPVLLLR